MVFGEENAVKLQELIGGLAGRLRGQEWGKYSKNEFENACGMTLEEIKKIRFELEQLEKQGRFETWSVQADLTQKIGEFSSLAQRLEKNLELEQKKSKNKLAEFDFVPREKKHNEQFSRLQFDTTTLMLKTNYVIEKLLLENKKFSFSGAPKTGTSQALLELLKSREEELNQSRHDYAKMRVHALTGQGAEISAAELEKDLQATSQKIAVQHQKLAESVVRHKKLSEEIFNAQAALSHETAKLQQLVWSHFDQNTELVTLLKKERDFARQIALDTENETAGLRSKYSGEILGLHEKVSNAHAAAKRENETRTGHLQGELVHKTQVLESLSAMVRKQQDQLDELQRQNRDLKLKLITYTKHDSAKKNLAGTPQKKRNP